MAKETTFFDNFARSIRLSIHTFAPGRVLSFDEAKATATIQPLFRNSEGNEYTPIEQVPVLSHKTKINGTITVLRPFLQPGDVVFFACAERALDNMDGGKTFDPDDFRLHHITDAVIVGVM